MKNLFLSAIFIATAFLSSAQIINVQTFEFQQVTLGADTTYSEPYSFNASYTFDLTQNTCTSFIDNNTIVAELSRYANLEDGTMVFVYTKDPSTGWYINCERQTVTFFQMQWSADIESRITKSVFIKY